MIPLRDEFDHNSHATYVLARVEHSPAGPLAPSYYAARVRRPVTRRDEITCSAPLSDDHGTSQDGEGPTASLGNNLIGDPGGCVIVLQASDLTGTAGPDVLADDGTAGNGHLPLLPTSAAIGAANEDACSKKDQLGVPRKKSCDIGAVEFDPHAK